MGKKSTQMNANSNLLKFSRQSIHLSQQQLNNNKEINKQKCVTTSTSLDHVLAMILMGICRKITNRKLLQNRLLIYLCLVLIGGLINDFAPIINRSFMFKINKNNFLNQWFVKIGWFWTSILTFPLMALTSHILTVEKKLNIDKRVDSMNKNNEKLIKLKQFLSFLRTRQLLRLLINTIVWFSSIYLFLLLEDMTGSCIAIESGNELKEKCLSAGHKWMPGFDISGHIFLLIFSNLILIEECVVMIGWEPFGHQLLEENQRFERLQQNHEQFNLYKKYSLPLRITFIAITILSVIWDFMLLQTSMFYHTMFQKLVAAIWAFSMWAFTYQYIYKLIAIDVKSPKIIKNT